MRAFGTGLEVTLVTCYRAPMSNATPTADRWRRTLEAIDPRRGLTAATVWLIVALAATFSIAATVWVGRLARENIVQQHARRLTLETDQLAGDAGQALAARLDAIRAVAAGLTAPSIGAMYARLLDAYPDLDWCAAADPDGRIVAHRPGTTPPPRSSAWPASGGQAPWIGPDNGLCGDLARGVSGDSPALGVLVAPVRDRSGQALGALATRLSWHWPPRHLPRLTEAPDGRDAALAMLLDRTGTVLAGPDAARGRRWAGVEVAPAPLAAGADGLIAAPRFERLAGGEIALVARAPIGSSDAVRALGWQVQLSEPREHVFARANALGLQILGVSLLLGVLTALAGAWGAHHLTQRLKRLTRSAVAVGRRESERIDVPAGHDEAAQLALAFARILDDLRQERAELRALSDDLERRVAARTREVERLAGEARYAAVVRERLKIARDLHDTLAHSMMAMLSEVRLLRRLEAHDPGALRDELERAEAVAHAGLVEARTAITEMRVNAVRDTGLGAALAKAFERFIDRTGVEGRLTVDPAVAGMGDERAEVLFRMAEEALRNAEHHAGATRVEVALEVSPAGAVSLSIVDDGVGFDPAAPRPGHFGIVGLREQANLIGARLTIESGPGNGARIRVVLPAPDAT